MILELSVLKRRLRDEIRQAKSGHSRFITLEADDLERILDENRNKVKRTCPNLLKTSEALLASVARVNGQYVTDMGFAKAIEDLDEAVLAAKL